MPACGRNLFTRIFCSVAFALTVVIGMGALSAKAGGLDEAFPAADWKRGKSAAGISVDCVRERCGPPAHVAYILGPAIPTMADRIRSGAINRDWAEKLAASFRKSQGDEIKVLTFMVQTGQVPGWSMLYECNCEGTTNYVSSRIVAGAKASMTFYSLGRTPEAAQENMNKMIVAIMGTGSR